jgi:hypothetical protein
MITKIIACNHKTATERDLAITKNGCIVRNDAINYPLYEPYEYNLLKDEIEKLKTTIKDLEKQYRFTKSQREEYENFVAEKKLFKEKLQMMKKIFQGENSFMEK